MNNFSTGDSTSPSQGKGMGGLGSILQNPAQATPSGKGQSQNQGLTGSASLLQQLNPNQQTNQNAPVQTASNLNGSPQIQTASNLFGAPQVETAANLGGNVTYPGQGGQPQMGQPNSYSNTIGPQTSQMSPMAMQGQGGKGKGA
jgi:hypothetical protein